MWLKLYKIIIQWNLYKTVTLGTWPTSCFTEVACSYSLYWNQLFLYINNIVYICDSSCSNGGVLLRVIDKLYPVTQRRRVLLPLLLSHFPLAHGWKPQEMTSQVVGKSACYKWPSYVIGYCEYKSVWSATVGETLRLTTELTNPQDPFAVTVI